MKHEDGTDASGSIEEAPDLHFLLYVRDFAGLRAGGTQSPPGLMLGAQTASGVPDTAASSAWGLWWSTSLTDREYGEPRSAETAIRLAPPELRDVARAAVSSFVNSWWPMVLPVKATVGQTPLLLGFRNLARACSRLLDRFPDDTHPWRFEVLALAAPWERRLAPRHWLLSTASLQQPADVDRWVDGLLR